MGKKIKEKKKIDYKKLFKEKNPDLPKDLKDYFFGKSYKDPETGEIKTRLIKKKSRQEPLDMKVKKFKGGLMVAPKRAKRGY